MHGKFPANESSEEPTRAACHGTCLKVTNLLLQSPSLCDRQRGVRRESEPVIRLVVSANKLPGNSVCAAK